MAYRKLFETREEKAAAAAAASEVDGASATDELAGAPLGGTRDEAMQRLQVGLSGLGAMVLLVGLASIIQGRALVSEEGAVPEAAPTTEPMEAAPQRDPLADAGVVPDLPVDPETAPAQEAAIVPEQGTGTGGDPLGENLLSDERKDP